MSIAQILVDALKDKLTPFEQTELITEFDVIQRALGIGPRISMGTMIIGSTEGIKVFDPYTGNETISLDPLGYLSIYDEGSLMVRLGNMDGEYGADGKYYGVGIGDYAGGNYLSYNAEGNGAFILKAGDGAVRLDSSGIEIDATTIGGEGQKQIKFIASDGSTVMGWIEVYQAAATAHYMEIGTKSYDSRVTDLTFYASGNVRIPNSADFYSTQWTDYSDTSTIVGWSSYTTKEIWYKKIGNLVFVQFHISGTSDAGDASFTLPYSQQGNLQMNLVIRVKNSGTIQIGLAILPISSSTLSCYANLTGAGFTSSGDKYILGQFWYETG